MYIDTHISHEAQYSPCIIDSTKFMLRHGKFACKCPTMDS